MTKIIIRDDDLNVTSSSDDIKYAYDGILESVPISFFIIPDLKNPNDTYDFKDADFYWKRKMDDCAYGKIWDNLDLINFLKHHLELDNISVGMHGVHHSYKEFNKLVKAEEIKENFKMLTKTFNLENSAISFPNNSLRSLNVISLEKYFDYFFIGYSHYIHERPVSLSNFYYFILAALARLTNSEERYIASGIRKVGNHNEISSIPVSYLSDYSIISKITQTVINSNSKLLCLATHYYDLKENSKTRKLLQDIIQELEVLGVEFIGLKQINK
jgi:hypothetical protein